ncbi:MAG: hypothetical protein IT428_32030 [Planctomycetaceae bacterium]|nr:hypothetical protein [Planctomycetaceae bacterium]
MQRRSFLGALAGILGLSGFAHPSLSKQESRLKVQSSPEKDLMYLVEYGGEAVTIDCESMDVRASGGRWNREVYASGYVPTGAIPAIREAFRSLYIPRGMRLDVMSFAITETTDSGKSWISIRQTFVEA